MGVVTQLSLERLRTLFGEYRFTDIIATDSGVMDTTYIVSNDRDEYILKKYERDVGEKIALEQALLERLYRDALNVPLCIDQRADWYLYTKLKGKEPRSIQLRHIQAGARFLAKLHRHTYREKCHCDFIQSYDIPKHLRGIKPKFYLYYKKLQDIEGYNPPNDGVIHGDIFKDNVVFENNRIGIFDFIDAGCGSFLFDAAVFLVGFDALKHKRLFLNLFLYTYNQKAPQKLKKQELLETIAIARSFYALLRISKYQNTKKAKELL